MGEIVKLHGSVQIEQQLPKSDEIIKMNLIDGWEDCTEKQKAYLCTYFKTYPKKIRACMESAISMSHVNKWLKENSSFALVYDTIEKIHMEELEYRDYVQAYTDKTVRGRVLDHKGSTSRKGDTHIYIEEKTMDKYLS